MKFRFILAFMAALAAFSASATVWEHNYKNLGSTAGDSDFLDATKWNSRDTGNPGSSDYVFTTNDILYVDSGDLKRLRITGGQTNAGALQAGPVDTADSANFGQVYLGGTRHAFANDGVKLGYCQWIMYRGEYASPETVYEGRFEVIATNKNQAATVCGGGASGQTDTYARKARFTGEFTGAENAYVIFFDMSASYSSLSNSVFTVDDHSGYAGTMEVKSRFPNAGAAFGVRLNLGLVAGAAKVMVGVGGSVAAAETGGVAQVKSLSFAAGTRLWVKAPDEVSAASQVGVLRATDKITVADGAKVEIWWDSVALGADTAEYPLLVGHADSEFTEDDFSLTLGDRAFGCDLSLAVRETETTRSLVLVRSGGFVTQLTDYGYDEISTAGNVEGGRRGGLSSLTNAASWWNELKPGDGTEGIHYYTDKNLGTVIDGAIDYTFPGASLTVDGGGLYIRTKSFSVDRLTARNAVVANGNRDVAVMDLIAPVMRFFGEVTVRAYYQKTFRLRGDIEGDGTINLHTWGSTSSPGCTYCLDGMNTNWTGAMTLSSGATEANLSFATGKFPILSVTDGRNLGGRRPTPDACALTLTDFGQLRVGSDAAATVTLADGLNRGVHIKDTGRLYVDAGKTLDVRWPVLLSGTMCKEGAGTLVLGGAMSRESEDNENIFEVRAGKVRVENAGAFSGATVALSNNTEIVLAVDPPDLDTCGIRNTATETPFVLAGGHNGQLPLSLDLSKVTPPCKVALVTVTNTAAPSVRTMLTGLKFNSGFTEAIVDTEENGCTTFFIDLYHGGLIVILK